MQEPQHWLPDEAIANFVIVLEDGSESAQDFLKSMSDQFRSDDNRYPLPYILRGNLDIA